MKTKKILSILLALTMLLSIVPFYASAEPIALTEANVTVWPTANGEIWFGQKVSDGITLTGGEVQYDGAVVAGHFEFIDPEFRPTSSGSQFAALKFIPEDSLSYTGFEVETAWDVMYTVNKTTPVFVDENDTVPVATEVEAGAKLSTSTLSGAQVMNPYYPEESKALAGVWKWAKSTTIVNESGYYEARITISGYERLTAQVYVKIASDIPETAIAEYPTISELTYDSDVTWGSLPLEGGKAVIKGTDTEVKGKFTLKDRWVNAVPDIDITEIEIVFTPDDPEAALPYEFKIPVKVNPCPISFGEDHKGTSIDDPFEYEVNPGTLMRDVLNGVKKYINYPPQSVFIIEDANYAAQNGRTYKITVIHDNTNYVGSEAYVKTVFKTVELTPTFKPGHLSSAIDCGKYSPAGTFTVTLDGKEIATVKANEEFTYTVENSGEYVLGAKYNPVENDYFIVADATQTVDVKLKRLVNRINCTSNGGLFVTYGDTVELSANATIETLDRWVITDESGNEVDLGIDLTQLNISFTMPDFNITAEAKLKGASSGDGTDEPSGGLDDIFGSLTEGDSDSPIVNIFNNILAWFRNLIETIKNFFRGIGDRT